MKAIESNLNEYIMVTWPDVQNFMDNPRWGECIFCQGSEEHFCPDNTYMIPIDLYKEVMKLK